MDQVTTHGTVNDLFQHEINRLSDYDNYDTVINTPVQIDEMGHIVNFFGALILEVKGDDGQINFIRVVLGEPVDEMGQIVNDAIFS